MIKDDIYIQMEKEMATHSSVLDWRIPWKEDPGGLQSMGLQKSRTRLSNFHTHSLTHVFTSHRGMTQVGEHTASWQSFIAETEDIA